MDVALAPLFLQSLWVGLSIAAPVGPIGLLVIQRTLQRGVVVGLVTGLGAATADAAYGALGAFGVASVVQGLEAVRVPLATAGGAFLLWLAWRIWRSAPPARAAEVASPQGRVLLGSFAGTFVLTLSNPATVLSFVAVFGSMAGRGVPASPEVMAAGVLAGSALWWLLLSAGVGLLRSRFDARAQRLVNRVSALLLAGFAMWQWASLLASGPA
ncbi:MAG: LysE family translocator [Rubrivivax sp.]|jgi:threonine/homoserine/homoserine lactone efflux protein|nr:LysE family translocator [Rubrivivax sp.]